VEAILSVRDRKDKRTEASPSGKWLSIRTLEVVHRWDSEIPARKPAGRIKSPGRKGSRKRKTIQSRNPRGNVR